jgi:hypothetical protein
VVLERNDLALNVPGWYNRPGQADSGTAPATTVGWAPLQWGSAPRHRARTGSFVRFVAGRVVDEYSTVFGIYRRFLRAMG